MTKTVEIQPDSLHGGDSPFRYVGLSWLQSFADRLGKLSDLHDQDVVIKSPGVRFASLFEWVSFVSITDQILRKPFVRSVQLDFRDAALVLLSPKAFLTQKEALPKRDRSDPILNYSEHLYDLVGFLTIHWHALSNEAPTQRLLL